MLILGIDHGVTKHGWAFIEAYSPRYTGKKEEWVYRIKSGDHTTAGFFPTQPHDRAFVEKPVYQGPARSQKEVIETAFNAGRFAGQNKAIPLTPVEWKTILFGKGGGITEAMVFSWVEDTDYVELPFDVKELPKYKKRHIYDAICIAIAGHKELFATIRVDGP